MANQLKMAKVNVILSLHQQGWSQRKIAEELNVNRETVAKNLRGPIPRSHISKVRDSTSSSRRPRIAPCSAVTTTVPRW